MKRIILLLALGMILASCSAIPTEYTSPCACKYEPINPDKMSKGVA